MLKEFCRTTSFGDIFLQIESLIQDFFHENLQAWDIDSVVGTPTLLLDLKNCDFSQAEVPSHGR